MPFYSEHQQQPCGWVSPVVRAHGHAAATVQSAGVVPKGVEQESRGEVEAVAGSPRVAGFDHAGRKRQTAPHVEAAQHIQPDADVRGVRVGGGGVDSELPLGVGGGAWGSGLRADGSRQRAREKGRGDDCANDRAINCAKGEHGGGCQRRDRPICDPVGGSKVHSVKVITPGVLPFVTAQLATPVPRRVASQFAEELSRPT
jgi:hypothetical protein